MQRRSSMKKQGIATLFLIGVIISFLYLQYGREEKIINSIDISSDSFYRSEINVVANQLYIFDKRKYAGKLIDMTQRNAYPGMKFSFDQNGYPNELYISVYSSGWAYRHNYKYFEISYTSSLAITGDYNIVENPDVYEIHIHH